tara:strand:- start:18825 stop:19361 length:537 start_codon:yes stop_codon:yes gene_type:complete
LWTRIISKIDHPDAALIPLLRPETPDNWPESLRNSTWMWTGAMTKQGSPILGENKTCISVARFIYSELIGELTKNHRLLCSGDNHNLNPLHHEPLLLERAYLPLPTVDTTPAPAFADDFDVDAIADYLDGLNPNGITDLRQKWPDMLREYYPMQIFEALKKANLATKLGLTSPLELNP